MHDLEAASAAAQQALELAATVTSYRSRRAIEDIHERLLAHRHSPYVGAYLNVAEVLVPVFS